MRKLLLLMYMFVSIPAFSEADDSFGDKRDNVISRDNYVCVPHKITGFRNTDNDWVSENFRVPDIKYLITHEVKVVDDLYKGRKETSAYLRRFGEESDRIECERGIISWTCREPQDSYLRVNLERLKYVKADMFGYVNTIDTPNLEIGTCAKLPK